VPTQNEIRERITAEVVAALEKGGLPPWRRPWGTSGPPANAATGRRYSGVNVLLLQLHRQRLGLAGPCRYATFRQWSDLGCRVKARPGSVPSGRWGCNVVFCKPVKKGERDEDDKSDKQKGEYLLLRNFTVFSVDQVEGEAADRLRADHAPQRAAFADYDPAEQAVAATGADIRHGSDRAFYRRPTPDRGDFIAMPHKHSFESEKEYYSTLLHELGHWSECRLKWTGSYAEGELRAEMASAFALAELGVPQSDDLTNHQTYLASWLKELRADPRFIFRVSADASRAVDFLLAFSVQRQDEPAEAVAV
jgi:antirestriction protein ArdC